MSLLYLAAVTFREGVRKKTLVAFLMFGMLTLASSMFLTVFSPGEEVKIVKDVCLTAITFFGMLITVFVSGAMVPAEMENRVFYTVISKPLRRSTYLLGKFLGAQALILLNLVLMSALFLVIVWSQSRRFSTGGGDEMGGGAVSFGIDAVLILKAMLLVYCEMAMLSALTLAASITATSPTLPVIFGVFAWLVGHLVDNLKSIGAVAGENEVVRLFVEITYNALPNLNYFYLRDNLVHSDPYIPQGMLNLVLYAATWVVGGLGVAYLLIRRKEA